MKPIHKFNGGKGATLCHTCRVIISVGLTDDLYCNKCNTMKKEFVPYEQALELIELGFDEPCYLSSHFNEESDEFIPTPLYQQAFRWFREKHDLFGCIDLQVCSPAHWYIRIDKIEINDYLYHSEDENVKHNTYEEAELACLKKLIEMVKTKQYVKKNNA